MVLTKQQAKENLLKLIEKYNKEDDLGRIKEYNEEATKTAFIMPLLKDVLGWDVNDRNEVSPEEKISRGRVDYGLKIDGKTKIFVEAKPPRADLNKHIEQAVRYGYNRKGVPFVLLTDFEGIKLFDVTVKPDSRNIRKGLKLNLAFYLYEKHFDEIWVLSKESVIKGELDKLLLKKPKDRIPVDKAILDDLKRWREDLAKDIYKNNSNLFEPSPSSSPTEGERQGEGGAEYLKEITQRILDRIIFMRFCEDRQFVHRQTLKELFEERTEQVGLNTMVFLKEEFKHYNIIFNSDLFSPKEWEDNLQIDFKVMKNIILDTYNPYQFDVIPLEVLGNIYEQYLGYTIRLTPQQVKYELKPDVRKAGGVYYTPEYIVDYIVKNTVGKLLKESSSQKIKKLRILDPACGSGSFLIRAYEEMLNYYKEQKKRLKPQVNTGKHRLISSSLMGEVESEGERQKELDLKHEDTEVRLTIHEKAEILKNHIFGVDIDEQAVEVTKLSLMLKMLEGEFGIIPGRNILPMLDKNIRCGNSLISGSPIELKKYFGDDYYKVKPFNWNEEFKEIMDDGGFDVVIGNPPYSVVFSDEERKYYENIYSSFEYQVNSFVLFMEKGSKLLTKNGLLSYIVPAVFLSQYYFKNIRELILKKYDLFSILILNYKVFEEADTGDTCVFIVRNNKGKDVHYVTIKNKSEFDKLVFQLKQQSEFCSNPRYEISININDLILKKISSVSVPLGEIAKCIMGIKPYQKGKGKPKQNEQVVLNRIFDSQTCKGKDYKKYLVGKDIDRYIIKHIEPRYIKYGIWLAEPREGAPFERLKIILRQTSDIIRTVLDENKYYNLNNIYNVELIDKKYNHKYILGILNSKFMVYVYQSIVPERGRLFAEIKKVNLDKLPIRKIDFSKSLEKKLHDNLVALVDVMLDLNKKIQSAKGSAKDQIQREITKTDMTIDQIVYKLYGITEEEKKIIEKDAR